VNVAQVQELARKELLLLLGKCDGPKVQSIFPIVSLRIKHVRIAWHTRGTAALGYHMILGSALTSLWRRN